MARALIRLGDSTSHGGTVIEASVKFTSDGIGIARVGDKVTCPIKGHGTNHIVSGDPTFIVDGQPVAREGDKTACGADLIPSQFVTTVSNESDQATARPTASSFNASATGASAMIPVVLAAAMAEKKDEEPVVTFGPNAKSSDVSSYSLTVLKDIMKKSGVKSATVSSTARDSTNQARVMYDNIQAKGVPHQKALYGSNGDLVIDVYDASKKAGKSPAQIKEAMKAKIDEIGIDKLSNHGGDQSKLNVFDVAPSSIDANKKDAFTIQAEADSSVSKFLKPPSDPGFHFEMPQPQ